MRISTLGIVLTACATTTSTPMSTPKGGPRGLRASEHLDVAVEQDQQARERSSWPSTTVMRPGAFDTAYPPVEVPWFRSWDTAAEHERMAATHRSQAAALQAAYDEACGTRPLEEVSVSPLVRFGVGEWSTASGVIIYLSAKAGPPDELLAALKCHRAFMMLAPADMDDCPLDLPGLAVDVRGDTAGITVSMAVKDVTLVPELKRRAAHEVEMGRRSAAAPSRGK